MKIEITNCISESAKMLKLLVVSKKKKDLYKIRNTYCGLRPPVRFGCCPQLPVVYTLGQITL